MRKLRLDLDALDVESFAVAAGRPGRGTVHGAQPTELDCTLAPDLCKPTGPEAPSCQDSCTGLAGCVPSACCATW
jgi:hypothetical protein